MFVIGILKIVINLSNNLELSLIAFNDEYISFKDFGDENVKSTWLIDRNTGEIDITVKFLKENERHKGSGNCYKSIKKKKF